MLLEPLHKFHHGRRRYCKPTNRAHRQQSSVKPILRTPPVQIFTFKLSAPLGCSDSNLIAYSDPDHLLNSIQTQSVAQNMPPTSALFRSARPIFQSRARSPFSASQFQNSFARSTARAGRRFQSTDAPTAEAASKSWFSRMWNSPVGLKTVHFWYDLYCDIFIYITS
jgi:hypothetical protein